MCRARDIGGGSGGGGAYFRWFDGVDGANRRLPLAHGDVVVFAVERDATLWHATYSLEDDDGYDEGAADAGGGVDGGTGGGGGGVVRVSLGLQLPADEVMRLYEVTPRWLAVVVGVVCNR